MSRPKYFAKRLIQMAVLWILIVVFLFFFFRLMPGDYTSMMLRDGADPETIQAFRDRWGLDDPLHVQLVRYLENVASLEFGSSISYDTPVWERTRPRLFNSAILLFPGITLGYILGSLWGAVIGNVGRPQVKEYGLALAVFVGTLPIFFLGLLFIIIFATNIDILPTSGMISSDVSYRYRDAAWYRQYLTLDFGLHYLLPFCVIALRYSSMPALLMRTSMDEVKGQGYAYYQRISGLPKRRRVLHIMKHASLPVITFYPLSLGQAIGGLVLLEYVFNWPGIGSELVDAVRRRDYPVVQFIFILIATFIIIGNFIVDIVYGIIDPRVSGTGEDE